MPTGRCRPGLPRAGIAYGIKADKANGERRMPGLAKSDDGVEGFPLSNERGPSHDPVILFFGALAERRAADVIHHHVEVGEDAPRLGGVFNDLGYKPSISPTVTHQNVTKLTVARTREQRPQPVRAS